MPKELAVDIPFFSIIVLNWNGERYLERCLTSIAAQTYSNFEVIVLDNASTDHSFDGIETRWPKFKVVRFEQNLGFSRANNIGAKQAAGKWLALLNNDAFPEPNWLQEFARAIEENPHTDFFSSLLLYADRPHIVQSSGDVYNISGFAWSRDNNTDIEEAHIIQDGVFSPSAAAALYRRDVFLKVGGFDETFDSHLEDVDLGFRLRLNGHKCRYIPEASVLHIGSASFGRESDRTVYQVQRNVIWAYFKNMPGNLIWKYLPAHLFANFVFLLYYSLRGQAGVVFKAKWDSIKQLRRVWKARSEIQANRLVTPKEISGILNHNLLAPFLLEKTTRRFRRHLNKQPSDGIEII